MSVAATLKQVKVLVRSVLGRSPRTFLRVAAIKPINRPLIVRPSTEIVIEGFPRSGNTFAVAAFELAQSRPVKIARHLHAPAQVECAVRWGVPALVLLRRPLDAVSSLLLRDPELPARAALCAYLEFYRRVAPVRSAIVVARFEEVTGDFGEVIARINTRYGSTFLPFEHSEENVRRTFERVEAMDRRDTGRGGVTEATVARPSEERDRRKDDVGEAVRREAGPLLARCEAIYRELADRPG